MRFVNSQEESYRNMIGKIYQHKKYSGNFKIQIVGLMYNPNRNVFIYIFKSLNKNMRFYDIQDFKRVVNNIGCKIKIFDIEENHSYGFCDCNLFDEYYLLLNQINKIKKL